MHTLLIQTTDLIALMGSGAPIRVFDCSFDLSDPEAGTRQFEQAHVTGATHAHLDRDLSNHQGNPALGTAASGGRHPLPTREAFGRWMGQQGITPSTQVVVYDRQGANYCGRLWWMLKWCGHEAVAVLDGGFQAWEQAGGSVASGPAASPAAAPAYPVGQPLARLVTLNELATSLDQGPSFTVVDARGAPRYRGEVEPLDPVAGHIPGALNRPFTLNIGADGRFKPAEVLRQEFLALLNGANPDSVVHHCGSGVSAVPNVLGMELAGLGRPALFAGSWSEWCNTPGLPVAKG